MLEGLPFGGDPVTQKRCLIALSNSASFSTIVEVSIQFSFHPERNGKEQPRQHRQPKENDTILRRFQQLKRTGANQTGAAINAQA
jgi:hypothetical protein